MIAIIHNNGKMQTVNAVIDTEMSREDLLRIVSKQYEKMQRMREDYNELLKMNHLLEQQNQRLLREKFALLEAKIRRG